MLSSRVSLGGVPLTALLPLLLCSSFTQAQPIENKALPVVTVVGTRFDQADLNEPVQTTVVTSDEIQRSGARTLADVLAQQTSLQMIDVSGSPNKQIDLRGFGMTGDQNTLLLIDGQRLTENELASADLVSIPLDSIERVEIMRGSGAVLYGRGATGGTINIITKKALDGKVVSRAGLTAGSFGTVGVYGSARVSKERVGFNIFFDRSDTDNYRRNNQTLQENVTATAQYAGDRGPISLRVSSGQQSLRLPGVRTAAQLASDPRGATTPNDYASLNSVRIALAAEQKFEFGSLAFDLTHRSREAGAFYQDFGFVAPDLTRTQVSSFSPRIMLPFQTNQVRHALTVGVDWEQWKSHYFAIEADTEPTYETDQRNSSLYARHTVNFTSSTSLAIGLRGQNARTRGPVSSAIQQSRWLHAQEVALRQDLDSGLSLYAKAGSSYRLQTADEMRFWGSLSPNILEPQTARHLDLGFNYEGEEYWAGINLFRTQLTNEIMYHPAASDNINLPPTERRGVELEGKWQAMTALRMEANYSFTEALFTSGSVNSQSLAGKQVPLVPKHKASVSAVWRIFTDTSLSIRTTYLGQTRLDGDQMNESSVRRPAYSVTDLIAIHDQGPWRLRASVLNIFDAAYFTYGYAGVSSFSAYPAMRRAMMLTVERRF